MKNKGFTLIELLAVIIILAIIALIAMPLVLNTIEKARKGAAEASAYAYAEEVDRYLVLSQIDPTLPQLQPGAEYQLSSEKYEVAALADPATTFINDLVSIKGDKPTSGYLILDGEYKIDKIQMVMKAYPVECTEDECKVTGDKIGNADTEAPVLELGEVEVTYNTITIPITKNEDNKKDEPVVKIYYGTTESLGEEVTCSNDKCEITGLTQKTTYYYKVVSKDKAGNSTTLPKSGLSTATTSEKEVLCKRAVKLNTVACNGPSSSYHCNGSGYADGDIITYGRLGERGKLTSGDAFDCDVDNDSKFEERFYYVTDSSAGNAVLIYNYNTKGGVKDTANKVKYDSSVNYNGPRTARAELPTTTQWKNPKIIYPTTRAILNENGESTTWKHNLTTAFSYRGYAARLLTAQELNVACNMQVGTNHKGAKGEGAIQKCVYFLENTNFSSGKITPSGYWLETASSSMDTNGWIIDAYYRNIKYVAITDSIGVRPVIEVAKEDIEI